MFTDSVSEVGKLIQDYLEQRQKSWYYHKKKTDAEKEYNKLLVNAGGEDKNFSLDQAEAKFNESDEKLKELGRILFRATITADITVPPINGHAAETKQVTVTFPNGEALVV
jgi:hypothetical protein